MNPLKNLRQRRGLTQKQLAELGGTSQPTIAAYESGAKSPLWRTLERLARSLGLEAMVEFIPRLTREDRRSLALHRAIARRLEQSPEATLARARASLARMANRNPGATPLLSQWQKLLDRPTEEIVNVLIDPRPDARELRQVTPFAGVLSAAERTAVLREFASDEEARR